MDQSELSLEEAIKLGAVDDDFYGHFFFPKTFRQKSPEFAADLSRLLDDPTARYVAVKMFRGSAKTSRLRIKISKLIAYGVSPLTLFVSNAQKHSIYSLKWIRKQVEFNTRWATAFGLVKGQTWSDEMLEIKSTITGESFYVAALGITGQIRGVNIDDLRPTYIVLDDPDNEETTATPEQRQKTSELVFGALQNSLVPETENPHAKMVVLQTPSASKEDLISVCCANPSWRHLTVSCFDARGQSTWPSRYPTEVLEKEKRSFVHMNKLSTWLREMECKVVSQETCSFKSEWLRYWDQLPDGMFVVLAIDPASSESKTADDQVVGALGFHSTAKGVDLYLMDYSANKGEMPDAAAATFFDFAYKYRAQRGAVESVAYQRVLAWYLQQEMAKQRRYLPIDKIQDQRKKSDRILQSLLPYAAFGHLYVHKSHTKFVEQFLEYSPNSRGHDDVLDMVSIGVMSYENAEGFIDGDFEKIPGEEKSIPALENWRLLNG